VFSAQQDFAAICVTQPTTHVQQALLCGFFLSTVIRKSGRFPLWQKQDVKRNCALTIKTHQENFADVGRFLNISGEIRKSWGLNVHSNGASKFCEQVIMSDKALSTHLK